MAFDPLDGSSIASANFAIGSIFGIWPGRGLVGRTGREQVAAAYAVYGPRTTIMVATRPSESGMSYAEATHSELLSSHNPVSVTAYAACKRHQSYVVA